MKLLPKNLETWLVLSSLVGCISLASLKSQAHGGLGHMQVTAWAVENLEQGELRAFLAHPDVFNSILFGAAYPDIGYYPGLRYPEIARQFAEYSHWPTFTELFIQWIRENDPPPWTSIESRKRIAFLMGCAAHGFQDEVFDTLFLDKVAHHDSAGQAEADSATDGFLVMDLLVGLIPDGDVPVDSLLDIYNASGAFEEEITEDQILSSVKTMTDLYIDEGAGPTLSVVAANGLLDVLIWTRENYMNPDIPGSLHSEIYPTMYYIEALWKRLRDEFSDEDVFLFSFPESTRRLRSHEAQSPDSWVSVMFSIGTAEQELTSDWQDSLGGQVEFEQKGTAWGGDWPRIMVLKPRENLVAGAQYTVDVSGTATGVDQSERVVSHRMQFQVACTEENLEECPELAPAASARLDGLEAFQNEWVIDDSDPAPPEEETSGCAALEPGSWELFFLVLVVYAIRRRPVIYANEGEA